MASASMTIKVDAKNLDRVKLLRWELEMLLNEMRVMASPHAERLESLLARFEGDEDGDRTDVA